MLFKCLKHLRNVIAIRIDGDWQCRLNSYSLIFDDKRWRSIEITDSCLYVQWSYWYLQLFIIFLWTQSFHYFFNHYRFDTIRRYDNIFRPKRWIYRSDSNIRWFVVCIADEYSESSYDVHSNYLWNQRRNLCRSSNAIHCLIYGKKIITAKRFFYVIK